MHISIWKYIIFSLLFSALIVQLPGCSKTEEIDYNIILISIDALRLDHMGCYGYYRNTSDCIDTIASQSIIFNNAVTPRPKTTASLATLLTGLYPYRTGIRDLTGPLKEEINLPSILKQNGYITAAFVSNWVLRSERSGFNQYFDYYDDQFTDPELNRSDVYERSAGKTNVKVIEWLKKNSSNKFFLWIHYNDPHGSYSPPEDYRDIFSNPKRQMVPADRIPAYQFLPEAYVTGDKTDANYYINQYDNEIYYTDKQIGELYKELGTLKLLDRSIIIITSDHGESLGEHNNYFVHGNQVYEDTCKIPLIINLPGEHRIKKINGLVSIMDLFPTILDFLGIENNMSIDGVSLVPLIEGSVNQARKEVFIECYLDNKYEKLAIRTDKEKLIKKGNRYEAYDLEKDILELNPHSLSDGKIHILKEKLLQYLDNSNRNKKQLNKMIVSEQDLVNLRALGYVQ